ncbi:MAG: SpoIIE family protein phosphatase [Phycisphaeraceae bacterium]|nr:SpoIIE family protein phosphatase [Phycisphaeraceae bacterium]
MNDLPETSLAPLDESFTELSVDQSLSLTDFLDLATLQEIQDSFSAVTRLATVIRDADDQPLTRRTDAESRDASDMVLDQLLDEQGRFIAPIIVGGRRLGSIAIEKPLNTHMRNPRPHLRALAQELGVPPERLDDVVRQAEESCGPNRAASVQFLYLLANAIARLCYDDYQARRRVRELSTLYRVSRLIAGHKDLRQVLDTAVQSVAEVMQARAAMIRLIEKIDGKPMLVSRASHNLSQRYIDKGHVPLDRSTMYKAALEGEVVQIEDMPTDARSLHPDDARREGLVSMLCAAIVHQGEPIGTLQLYSAQTRRFSAFEVNLLRAIAQMLAAAIENARLETTRHEHERLSRQLHLAASVQRRMLPTKMPQYPPFEIAARYIPSFELGGDFYDFIDLDQNNLGIAIGDVVGKGIAASLLMASVRASLRAYAQDVYDLDEIIARCNVALCRDTLDNEFATLWYGVFNPETHRLTYCNAGHNPPLLLRDGRIHQLATGGMIVGVDETQHYEKGIWDLNRGDLLLLYTDGLVDAFNADGRKFGNERVEQTLRQCASKSATDALNHLHWTVRQFTGTRRSIDDTSLVVVKVN